MTQELEDYEVAKYYCRTHPLARPKTTWIHAVIYGLSFNIVILILEILLFSNLFALNLGLKILIGILIWGLITMFAGNYFLILLIECYQHYAKEETRRRCVCKPSCSEYSIMILKRHILPVAAFYVLRRIKFKCVGDNYNIDYSGLSKKDIAWVNRFNR